MSDPSGAPDRSDDQDDQEGLGDETSDPGGDSDPDANEGFEPPDADATTLPRIARTPLLTTG